MADRIARSENVINAGAVISDEISNLKDYRQAERLMSMFSEIISELTIDINGHLLTDATIETEKVDSINFMRKLRAEKGLSNG